VTSTTTDRLVLLPAVDVADGQAVRLVQGAAGSETSYGEPLAAALAWQDAGRRMGAPRRPRTRPSVAARTASSLAQVVGKLDVAVEMSGGIRDDASLEAALATGCAG
jgi:phosphoribosylanthranilate isomerase